MKGLKYILGIAGIILLVFLIIYLCYKPKTNYVIMLSLDGFRWDYPDRIPTPNLDYIAENGVKARSLQASFPTKTFPNHYSMATGLYPDNHGIVLNGFYDPELNAYYNLMDRSTVEDPRFYGGEPIWVTAEKQGIISASYFWVGSEAPVKGIQPTYWKRYDHDFPFHQRIDTVIHWLNLPEEIRPRLITFYMHEPDGIGHDAGPESQELYNTVVYLDSLVGVLIRKVNELPIAASVNIIVTSDHGMGPISNERRIVLENYIEKDWFDEIQGYNPNYVFKVKEAYRDTALKALQAIEHVMVWEHGKLPSRLNYGNNPRTLDFIMVADSSWSIVMDREKQVGYGAHGYDNANKDMHAIFYAMGPAFKMRHMHPTFANVDIYPLIARVLDLEPARVDGSFERVKGLLRNED
jgi:alkaline phosphatase D